MGFAQPRARTNHGPKADKNKIKLNQKVVEALPAPDPSGKQRLYWDIETPGLAVQVSGTTNDKRYVVRAKMPWLEQVNIVLGKCALLSYENARIDALQRMAELAKGHVPPKSKRSGLKSDANKDWTLQQALDAYLANNQNAKGQEFSKKSIRLYTTLVRLYMADWANRPLYVLTKQMCRDRHREIAAAKSTATANNCMKVLSAIYSWAVSEEVPGLAESPVKGLKWYEEVRRDRTLKTGEIPEYHAAIMRIRKELARDWFRLIFYTGLRYEESCSLRWTDIDFDERVIIIPALRNKGRRMFVLPMSRQVEALLRYRLAHRKLIKKESWRNEFVFAVDGLGGNKAGHITSADHYLEPVFKSTGLRRSPHDFRRVFASACAKAGVTFSDLKCLMNHSRKGVTMGYIIPEDADIRVAAQKVADKIDELCKGRPQPANSNVASASHAAVR